MAIICEICGSTNIVKTGDNFVCSGCGVSYSKEDIKAMLSGSNSDPVNVSLPYASEMPLPGQLPQSVQQGGQSITNDILGGSFGKPAERNADLNMKVPPTADVTAVNVSPQTQPVNMQTSFVQQVQPVQPTQTAPSASAPVQKNNGDWYTSSPSVVKGPFSYLAGTYYEFFKNSGFYYPYNKTFDEKKLFRGFAEWNFKVMRDLGKKTTFIFTETGIMIREENARKTHTKVYTADYTDISYIKKNCTSTSTLLRVILNIVLVFLTYGVWLIILPFTLIPMSKWRSLYLRFEISSITIDSKPATKKGFRRYFTFVNNKDYPKELSDKLFEIYRYYRQ